MALHTILSKIETFLRHVIKGLMTIWVYCLLPLWLVLVLAVAPAVLAAAAALSPLVLLCYAAVYAAKAVYISYLMHYDVPDGVRPACYWPVVHRAFMGAVYALHELDALYTVHIKSLAEDDILGDEGLYRGWFGQTCGHAVHLQASS